jgi:hypothetical protein
MVSFFARSILDLLDTALVAENSDSVSKAVDLLNNRQKLIKLAEQSEHGWATVAEYEANELAEDEDDGKKILRAEARAGRKIKQKQTQGNKQASKRFKRDKYSNDASGSNGNNQLFRGAGGPSSRFQPQGRGACHYCGKFGHWKESCSARRTSYLQRIPSTQTASSH